MYVLNAKIALIKLLLIYRIFIIFATAFSVKIYKLFSKKCNKTIFLLNLRTIFSKINYSNLY